MPAQLHGIANTIGPRSLNDVVRAEGSWSYGISAHLQAIEELEHQSPAPALRGGAVVILLKIIGLAVQGMRSHHAITKSTPRQRSEFNRGTCLHSSLFDQPRTSATSAAARSTAFKDVPLRSLSPALRADIPSARSPASI